MSYYFFSRKLSTLLHICLSRISSMLESKEIGLQFRQTLCFFLYIGIILLFFKLAANNPVENDWLNRNASWSDMYLFKQFQNFNRDTLSSVTLVSVQRKNNIGNFSAISRSYKNDLIFKGERYILILFLENLMED